MTDTFPQTDDTRIRILKAAAEIIAEKGYTRTTTRAIAEAAGVNEVTIFRHFGSKRNLFSEMIQPALCPARPDRHHRKPTHWRLPAGFAPPGFCIFHGDHGPKRGLAVDVV